MILYLRHFRLEHLSQFEIEAQSPDTFLCNLFYQYPQEIMYLIVKQAQNLRHPPITLVELLNILEKQVPHFVGLLRQSY